MIYTIYYGTRPNGTPKIGCDEAYPNRPIKQNLTNYYIVEEHTDEMVASRRERELQKEHGLKVDKFPYHLRKVYGGKGGNTRSSQESFRNINSNRTRESRNNAAASISIALKEKYSDPNYIHHQLGIHLKEDTKQQISETLRQFTDEEEAEIFNKYIPRKYTQSMLAEEYDIHWRTVQEILKRHKKRATN